MLACYKTSNKENAVSPNTNKTVHILSKKINSQYKKNKEKGYKYIIKIRETQGGVVYHATFWKTKELLVIVERQLSYLILSIKKQICFFTGTTNFFLMYLVPD
jgi:hypothetical protein